MDSQQQPAQPQPEQQTEVGGLDRAGAQALPPSEARSAAQNDDSQSPEQPTPGDDDDDFGGAQFSSAGVITEEVAQEISEDRGGYFEFVNPSAIEVAGDYGSLKPVSEEGEEEADGDRRADASLAATSAASTDLDGPDGSEDAGMVALVKSMQRAQIEQLAAMQISSLEREYVSTLASAPSAAAESSAAGEDVSTPESAAAKAYAASLQASGFDPADTALPSDPAQAKARKLAELKARLAASRAMRAAGGSAGSGGASSLVSGGLSFLPTMELAAGSEDFPEGYEELQMADHRALLLSSSTPADGATETAAAAGAPAKTVPLMAPEELKAAKAASAAGPASAGAATKPASTAAAAAADFDPFNINKKASLPHNPAISLPQPKQPPRAVRAVSPLPEDKKKAIGDIMSRIKINPRPGAGVSLFAEKAVEAALVKGKAAREAYDREQKTKE